MTGTSRGIPRRAFIQSAVAIGGASALAACLEREEPPELSNGPSDLSTLPNQQHAWNEYLSTDDHGNTVSPRHHLILLLDYTGDTQPGSRDVEQVETVFRGLEHAYHRGNNGLVFTVGYSPRYFDRFDELLPDNVDLPEPTALAPFENPVFDRPDAIIHLASDYGQVVLGAEQALLGDRDTLNGVAITSNLAGIFELRDRRTGFVGHGLPADHQDVRGIPDSEPVADDAPLFMGFKSGFKKNQATEDQVTIQTGPFAGGTTQHVSRLRLNLDQWYDQDSRYHRVATMFCPVHAEEDLVEGTGENLGDTSLMEERGCPAATADHARTYGVVGHSQKAARIRRDSSPLMIRRDFNSTDDGEAGLHFLALQRTITDFVDTRTAMNGTDVAANSAVGQRTNNGILQYFTVLNRGNYLLPPRSHRSLPTPHP